MMSMICKKCKKIIPSGSTFCMHCGKDQTDTTKKKKRKPNYRGHGLGSVTQCKDHPRAPYRARVNRKHIGYFQTGAEANQAIIEYLASIQGNESQRIDWTLEQFYNAWGEVTFPTITRSGINAHKASWKYMSSIQREKMKELKTSDYQNIIDLAVSEGKSRAVCEKIRNLISLLCQEAMKDDVIDKNYARLLRLPKNDKKEKDIFTDGEINLLISHDEDFEARLILILIYSGMRIGELLCLKAEDIDTEKWIIIGGSKTEAGKNRVIPIHPKIREYVKLLTDDVQAKDSVILNIRPELFRDKYFYKYLVSLGILTEEELDVGKSPRLTPHCTRHTFASLARRAGIEKDVLTRVIGHTEYSTTDEHYVSMGIDVLSDEISKI